MGEMSVFLKEFVEFNLKSIVDKPNSVVVTASISTKSIILQIKVDQIDCGKIIGRSGKTIESLKTLCHAAKNTKFSDDQRKITLEILEDENSKFSYKNRGIN